MEIVKIILLIPVLYLTFYSAYWLVCTLLGIRFKTTEETSSDGEQPEILVVLPAYEPGPIFKKVLDAAFRLHSTNRVTIYCLMQNADRLLTEYARDKGAWVEEKSFSHLSGNSYHHALKHVVMNIEYRIGKGEINPSHIMILDKDNLVNPKFLRKIPVSHWRKYDVIQGKRSALSTQDGTSLYDAISESLNDVMYRAAFSRLHLLPEVSGSAALIRSEVFFSAIKNLDSKAPGYDKNFMVQLLKLKAKGTFVPEAYITEEKTNDLQNYQPQRVRWFGEQYFNALFSAGKLLGSFLKGNLSALNYLIVLWRPPRSIQVLLVPTLGLLETSFFLITDSWFFELPLLSLSSVALSIAALVFLQDQKILKAAFGKVFDLPALVLSNLFSAGVSIRKENRGKFIHTNHKL